jgi:DNA-binding transcriptional MerR regulator
VSEYRLEELARQAGTTVRNIRAYRDRGLLPPPRRQGRVALYSDAHLARLRLVADLLERGYTLSSIGELLAAWERGKDISEVLGLEAVLTEPWSAEEVVTVTLAELQSLNSMELTDAQLAIAEEMGVLERIPDDGLTVDGSADEKPAGGADRLAARFRVISSKQLLAGAELAAAGIPLDDVLALGLRMHAAIDAIGEAFVRLVSEHLFDPLGDIPPADEMAHLAETVQQLRPLAATVVDAELNRSMEKHIHQFLGARFDRLAPDIDSVGEAS